MQQMVPAVQVKTQITPQIFALNFLVSEITNSACNFSFIIELIQISKFSLILNILLTSESYACIRCEEWGSYWSQGMDMYFYIL